MTLHLFDTATRTLRALEPLRTGEVGIYVCGATVQASPHVGHLRTDVAFDVLVRWLRRSGLAVTLIRNVTDIDDKILSKAGEAGVPWWAWAQRFEREFTAARDALGLVPATYEPRATGHVTDMVELMTTLVEKGHAYTTADGDVWFDVRAWPDYGSLTNQGLEDVGASPDESTSGKRDPRDFALWKATKPSDPPTASWPTPFGRGRPGWHLECSAMAHRYLGDTFDIHGGGLDLRFPHHENEQAQSRAAGRDFARLWMHSAWVTQSGTKMSKSLGNTLTAAAVLAQARPVVVRWALAAVHYRSMLEWTPDTLAEAAATWERIEGFVGRAEDAVGAVGDVTTAPLPERFTTAMDDDLNVPAALAVVHDHVRQGNSALAAGGQDDTVRDHVVAVRAMLDALGLDPVAWAGQGDGGREAAALDALVAAELEVRTRARAERDWAAADAVRDRLAAAGVVVEDSPEGPRWSLTREQED